MFDQALQVEPDDPDALAGSAYTYYVDFAYGWSDAPIDYETKVLEQASRAIALAPDNVRAYFVKAIYLATSGRPTEALGAADAGLAINPNFVCSCRRARPPKIPSAASSRLRRIVSGRCG